MFFWESDPEQTTTAVCGIRTVFEEGIWEGECSGIRLCFSLNGRSCYNIGLYCGECCSHSLAHHSYCTPAAVMKTETHQEFTRPAKHQQVTDAPTHNRTTGLVLISIVSFKTCWILFSFSSFVFRISWCF